MGILLGLSAGGGEGSGTGVVMGAAAVSWERSKPQLRQNAAPAAGAPHRGQNRVDASTGGDLI